MTVLRTKISSVALLASLLALWGGPLATRSPHEVCELMRHACATNEIVTMCCCGDRGDGTPSQTAADRADGVADTTHSVAILSSTFGVPPAIELLAEAARTPLSGPPNLPILLSDLRL